MNVVITKVTPVYSGAVYVQWDYTPEAGVFGATTFELYRSGSPEGPWVKAADSVVDTVFALDSMKLAEDADHTQLQSVVRALYYRVVATDAEGNVGESVPADIDGNRAGDVFQQGPLASASTSKRKFLLRRKIIRDESLAFRKLNGVEMRVLKRRHFGTPCPVCVDTLTKLTTKAKCFSCFSTGWLGGYFNPISTYARLSPTPASSVLTAEGKSDINTTTITLLNYPLVATDDLLVEPETDDRWRVAQMAPTTIRKIAVHQRVSVTLLPRSSPEYKIPV